MRLMWHPIQAGHLVTQEKDDIRRDKEKQNFLLVGIQIARSSYFIFIARIVNSKTVICVNFIRDKILYLQKLSRVFGKTESELLKVEIIIRKFIFMPSADKNTGKNY